MFLFATLPILLPSLVQAADVYLNPPLGAAVSPNQPRRGRFELARHLGLDLFETMGSQSNYENSEETFIGKGQSNALFLAIERADTTDLVPILPSFEISDIPSESALEILLESYVTKAEQVYDSIYTTPLSSSPPESAYPISSFISEESSLFLTQISTLSQFLEEESTGSKFAVVSLTGLSSLRKTLGASSEQYQSAVRDVQAVILSALAQENLNFALLTYQPSVHAATHDRAKRAEGSSLTVAAPSQAPLPTSAPPNQPLSSLSTCFATEDACVEGTTGNATSACSGKGNCVKASTAGKTCFVCACGTTTSSTGRTEVWAGQMCERKDVSGAFTLLVGTTLTLLILIGGSVSLLSSVGGEELPGTLLAGGGVSKRD